MKEEFKSSGYRIKRGLFSPSECKDILKGMHEERHLAPLNWNKGCAASIPCWTALARNDRIADQVADLIGAGVILWGAHLVQRMPKQIHHWHNDLESCRDDGFVSVWIGLKNTEPDTSLKVIPGSHLFPRLLMECAAAEKIASDKIEDQHVLPWARRFDKQADINQLDTSNGDALFFDGRLWHGSRNSTSLKKRVAVLLQYARADRAVHIPKLGHKRWPMEYYDTPRPPCILIRGSLSESQNPNTLVRGPSANPMKANKAITTLIEPIQIRADEPGEKGFQSFQLLHGPSTDLRYMECHYSVLSPGKSPHPPHIHDEEEVLIVVQGEGELICEKTKGSNDLETKQAMPGDFIYYPDNWRHTIRNASEEPVVYLMFKWITDGSHEAYPLPCSFITASETLANPPAENQAWKSYKCFEGQTRYLRKIKSHCSIVAPGQAYEPHSDAYDVAILLYEGSVETLGQTVTAPSLIYYAMGEPHGMRNAGGTIARYVVIEFHGKHGDIYEHPRYRRRRKLKESIRNPGLLVDYLKRRFNRKAKK